MNTERTPPDVREGVRTGILSSIKHDVELRGGRTARLLIAAGFVGVAGALGITLLVSTHPFGQRPPWHVAVFSATWSGLLVVSFAVAFLRVRTPTLPLARSACIGILGLGLAGICGAVCPGQHFLYWWSGTEIGTTLTETGGRSLSTLCFGLVATLVIGVVAAFVVLREGRRPPVRPLLPAAILLVLLSPGVALQSFGSSFGVFMGWLVGTAVGAYLGVASGIWLGGRLRFRRAD
jgi:hypothetical protein